MVIKMKVYKIILLNLIALMCYACNKKEFYSREDLQGYYVLAGKVLPIEEKLIRSEKNVFTTESNEDGALVKIIGFYNQKQKFPNGYMVIEIMNNKKDDFYILCSKDLYANDFYIQKRRTMTRLANDGPVSVTWDYEFSARGKEDQLIPELKPIRLKPKQSVFLTYCFSVNSFNSEFTMQFRYFFSDKKLPKKKFPNIKQGVYDKIFTGPVATYEVSIRKLKNAISKTPDGNLGSDIFKPTQLLKLTEPVSEK
jgi:hypothetical protein